MAGAHCDVLGCECACHRQKRRQAPRLWTPKMDQTVTELLNRGEPVGQIASRLYLTEDSIRWRIKQLGCSTRDGWRSRQEVTAVLGTSRRAVDRWMRAGLLKVAHHGTRWTRVRNADLEVFVVAHAGALFDPDGVQEPRLRRLAETSALVNRRRASA
jgi:hypothetical protein